MLTWVQATFLGLLQGFSELFPVSSLGHTVLLPTFFGWGNVQSAPTFLPFVVMLHLGTATALLWFYRDRWIAVIRAFVVSAVRGRLSHTPDEHLAWMLFFGTIPAGIIGAVLEKPLKQLFATPLIAAIFLIVNGGIMLLSERLRTRQQTASVAFQGDTLNGPRGVVALQGDQLSMTRGVDIRDGAPGGGSLGGARAAQVEERTRGIQDLTWRDAIMIGSAQALALIPGISRSGVTMCAGLLRNMGHEEAANYTFMLATPIILAAGLLEVPTLVMAGGSVLAIAIVGGLLAGLAAYLSVRFLVRYFQFGHLDPFAYYCIALGVVGVVFVAVHGG
ncbi:MAG TPA: undecaprenyl-diphosphate phosphatase [Thermomicrobiaceae bacterium]|nr:undecaprenyl-diphosphate phosphatase [Thermomicrobiaceae bacterium]